jgi:hypothetical protein
MVLLTSISRHAGGMQKPLVLHDLDLYKGCQFTVPLGPLAAQKYRNLPCKKVAAALTANLFRSLGLVMIAGHSFKSGKDWQKCVSVHEHYFGEHQPDEEHFARRRDEAKKRRLILVSYK